MHHRIASLLPSIQHEDIIEKVNETIDVCEKEGFTMKEINRDKELKKAVCVI